jgi:hypothetical protein
MGILHKLTVLTRGSQIGSAGSDSPTNTFKSFSRRSRAKIAGAFLLVPVLAVAGASVNASDAKDNANTVQSDGKTNNVQVSHSAATSSPTDVVDSNDDSTSSTSLSTTTTTTGSGPTTSTQVTVNGHPVAVPANGSSQQTITNGSQKTTVQVSHNQSTGGNASNHTYSSSHVNVSGSSSSDSSQQEDVSP